MVIKFYFFITQCSRDHVLIDYIIHLSAFKEYSLMLDNVIMG